MANIEGLNSPVYAKGSTFPKYADGKIRLYNMRFCPYAHRAVLALAAKNLEFEVINIHLVEKPEWYLEKINPMGKVPSIQYNNKIIYESLVCAEWAEDNFDGSRKIMPKDIFERAQQKMLVERLSKLPSTLYPFYRNRGDEKSIKNVHEAIQLHEDLLSSDYFSGSDCGFVDYMVWPFLERLEAVALMSNGVIAVTQDKYKKLSAYMERMKQRPEVKIAYHTPEEHLGFFDSVLCGKPNYDLGLSSTVEGLNTKALKKGCSFPTYVNGKIRLYNMRLCPYAHRACLALAAKNLPFEIINIHLGEKPEWFAEKINPLEKVPVIQFNDQIVYESLVCAEWVDDEFAGCRKILPADHYERAKQKMLIERLGKLPGALYPWFASPNDQTKINNVVEAIQLHETLLQDCFFAGKECGWIDYMAWPFIERLEGVAVMSKGQLGVTKDKYPKLFDYMQRMKSRTEVKTFYRTGEVHAGFRQSVADGKANYDIDM